MAKKPRPDVARLERAFAELPERDRKIADLHETINSLQELIRAQRETLAALRAQLDGLK